MTKTISTVIILSGLAAAAFGAESSLRVGASRPDITPAPAELPAPYQTAHDRIYVRTILLDDGNARAAIVVADVPMIEASIFNSLAAQISRDAGCPLENVRLAISHAHNSIRVDTSGVGKNIPFSLAFNSKVKEAIGKSVGEAKARMQPARAGFGRGRASIAVNRNQWVEKEQRYIVGADRTGTEPFDDTVAVVEFENLAAEPIAFLINYGIEPVVNNASRSEISGDVPGAVSRYVEERYFGKAVAAFTIGAAGNPIYSAGGGRSSPGRVPSSAHDILGAMATMLGEEVLAVSDEIRSPSAGVSIRAALKTLRCRGKINDTTQPAQFLCLHPGFEIASLPRLP